MDAEEFAEYLKAERERRRLTLEQVSDETKIASKHLAALERGDVRSWPGGMYRRAMMRAYADSIGVDREFALEQFEQAFPTSPAAPASMVEVVPPAGTPIRERRAGWRPTRRQVVGAAASMFALIAAALLWTIAASFWSADGGGGVATTQAPAATVAAAPTLSAPALSAPAVSAPALFAPASSAPASSVAAPASSAPARPSPAAAPPQPATLARAVDREAARAAAASPQETTATTGSNPRPAASEANLVVESVPPGARVTVNGVGWGHTPITIRHLELGSKRVRLTLQDHLSEERVVQLGPARGNVRLNVAMRQRK